MTVPQIVFVSVVVTFFVFVVLLGVWMAGFKAGVIAHHRGHWKAWKGLGRTWYIDKTGG